MHPNSGSGLRRWACSLLGFVREDLDEGVVATDTASANADCDNGAVALYGTPRLRGLDGGADRRLAAVVRHASKGRQDDVASLAE